MPMRAQKKCILWVAAAALWLGPGCKEQELQQQVNEQQETIRSLQEENSRLKEQTREIASLRTELEAARKQPKAPGHDIEMDRASLEQKLKGAGVSVGVREGRLAVILPSKVFFDPGKAALSRQGANALQSVARIIKSEFPGKVLRVEGHTDSTPIQKSGYKSNLELSNERAETVWHYLTDKCGVDPRKVYTAGFSEYRPIASNSTSSGQQQNRRVELVVIQE